MISNLVSRITLGLSLVAFIGTARGEGTPIKLKYEKIQRLCEDPALLASFDAEKFAMTCFQAREEIEHTSDDPLMTEKQVCNCISAHPTLSGDFNAIANKPTDPSGDDQEARVQALQTQARLTRQKIELSLNAMAFEASLLFQNPEQATKFAQVYPRKAEILGLFVKDGKRTAFVEDTTRAFNEGTQGFLKQNASLASDPRSLQTATSKVSLDLVPQVRSNEDLFFDKEKMPANQCVSAREYLSFKKLPADNAFYQILNDTETFVESDWEIMSLTLKLSRFRENDRLPAGQRKLFTKAEEEQRTKLIAKIKFLERNPMFKNLFGANKADAEMALDRIGAPEAEKKALSSLPAWNKTAAKKAELFQIMKKLTLRDPSCLRGPKGACQRALTATQAESIAEFKRATANFFIDPDVQILTNEANRSQVVQDLEDLRASTQDLSLELPTDPNQLETLAKANRSGLVPRSECKGLAVNIGACMETFKPFCALVNRASRQQHRVGGRDELYNDLETSIAENQGLQHFNEDICSKPRRSKDKKKSSTFSQFKETFCRTNACSDSPAGIAKIRDKFLDEYPNTFEDNKQETRENEEYLAFHNYMKGFRPPEIPESARVSFQRVPSETDLDRISKALYDSFEENSSKSVAGRSIASEANVSGDTPAAPQSAVRAPPTSAVAAPIAPQTSFQQALPSGFFAPPVAEPPRTLGQAKANFEAVRSEIATVEEQIKPSVNTPEMNKLRDELALLKAVNERNQAEIEALKAKSDLAEAQARAAPAAAPETRASTQSTTITNQAGVASVGSQSSAARTVSSDPGAVGPQAVRPGPAFASAPVKPATVRSLEQGINTALLAANDRGPSATVSQPVAGLVVTPSRPGEATAASAVAPSLLVSVDGGLYDSLQNNDGKILEISARDFRIPSNSMVKITIVSKDDPSKPSIERNVRRVGDKVVLVDNQTLRNLTLRNLRDVLLKPLNRL